MMNLLKPDISDNFTNIPSERIEPSFLDSKKNKCIKSTSYENNYDREI